MFVGARRVAKPVEFAACGLLEASRFGAARRLVKGQRDAENEARYTQGLNYGDKHFHDLFSSFENFGSCLSISRKRARSFDPR